MTTRYPVLREGLVVGLIGYAAIAVFYGAFDAFAARGTLFTVDMLSRSLLGRAPEQSTLVFPIQPDVAAILAYNVLHLVTSLAIGLTVVGLVELAERRPGSGRLALAIIVTGYVLTILAVGALSRNIRSVIPWWSIVTVNSLAVMLAGAYLLRKRPGVMLRLVSVPPRGSLMPPM